MGVVFPDVVQDRVPRTYDSSDLHSEGVLRGTVLSRLLAPFGVSLTDGDVLDLGCGYGGYGIVSGRAGARVVGVDISQHKIDVANERLSSEDPETRRRLTFVRADVTGGLPLEDSHFDTVISMGVIEWVALNRLDGDPQDVQTAALREVHRVLKTGGKYVLGTKNRWYPSYAARDPQMRWPLVNYLPRRLARAYSMLFFGQDYRTYLHSLDGWSTLLRNAGFRSVECYLPVYYYQFPIALWAASESGHSIAAAEAKAAATLPENYLWMAKLGRTGRMRRAFLSLMLRAGWERKTWPAVIIIATA